MKKRDHRALARYLMDNAGGRPMISGRWHRRFFVLGSVLPDYLPFTYLHGFRYSRGMRGHDARYTGGPIGKKIRRLEQRGVQSLQDCLTLGILMHYLADSFTYVHNAHFEGDMREHRRYERELHTHFSRYLQNCPRVSGLPSESNTTTEIWKRRRREYDRGEQSCLGDCRGIVHGCRAVFSSLCR